MSAGPAASIAAELAKDAAKPAISWLGRQETNTVFQMLFFAVCVAYGGWQMGVIEPARQAAQKESDAKWGGLLKDSFERSAAANEKQSAAHVEVVKSGMEHGEKRADAEIKRITELHAAEIKRLTELIEKPAVKAASTASDFRPNETVSEFGGPLE